MTQALILAQDKSTSSPGGKNEGQGSPPMFNMLFLMLIMFGIIYFLLIRPQSKERKRHAEMLQALKKNDQVVTQGGVFGTVAAIDGEGGTVSLKVADNVRIKVSRSAIARKIETEKQ
jgi:preprotein translocase subunit YajC